MCASYLSLISGAASLARETGYFRRPWWMMVCGCPSVPREAVKTTLGREWHVLALSHSPARDDVVVAVLMMVVAGVFRNKLLPCTVTLLHCCATALGTESEAAVRL